ncbi:MAG: biotin synthase BioB [Myxococcota bacterium]
MFDTYQQLAEKALHDQPPSHDEANWILDGPDLELLSLLQAAFAVRRKYFGRRVGIQVLNNVQNGLCPEDCGYCAQSKVTEADIRQYPMKSDQEIFTAAEEAARGGAARYCMALSGRGPSVARTQRLAGLIRELKDRYPMEICLSAGILGDPQAKLLAEAGLDRLNHNLNTSERHYEAICTTHDWSDRVSTLEAAKRYGIETCSGLIIGMGETSEDIIEVALKLLELETPSIPVNFLIPIDGNPVQDDGSLTPERCLRALCLMRLTNPRAEIRMAGGREGHLRGLQSLGLYPANSLFVGGYLTTQGDPFAETYAMIEDAGFEVAPSEGQERPTKTGRLRFRLTGDRALLRPDVAPTPR